MFTHLDRRVAFVGCATTFLALFGGMNGCGETIQPSAHIVVERELLLADLRIQPHQVIQIANGNFIIAGERGQVSAVSLSKDGDELWKYEEPYDPRIPGAYQGKFTGVIPLRNGDLLFCGEQSVVNPDNPQHPGSHTITRVLSPTGTLKTSNTIDPSNSSLHAIPFLECSPSDDGALIFGSIYNPLSTATSLKPDFRWVVKVDRDGKKISETLRNSTDQMKPPFAAEHVTPSGAIFWSFPRPGNEILHLTRLSVDGEIRDTHDYLCSYYFFQFSTIEPSDDQSFLCGGPKPNTMIVIRFNGNRQTIPAPIELNDGLHALFNPQLGTGYVLNDGSFLAFGRIPTQTGDRALIQLFDKAGHSLGFRGYDLQYPSFGVESVIALGNNRFLALRQHLNTGGTIMSWIHVQ